jgi:hypothetical protein
MVKAEFLNYSEWVVAMGEGNQTKDTKHIIAQKNKFMNSCAWRSFRVFSLLFRHVSR